MSIVNLKTIFSVAGVTLFTLFTPNMLAAQDLGYGTSLRPRSCPSRAEPKTGKITAKQAAQYVICHFERGESFVYNGAMPMSLVRDLKIEVAPKPRRARGADVEEVARFSIALNTEQPVYDIRGSFNQYICSRRSRLSLENNCGLYVRPSAQGICFKNNFNDWYCLLGGSLKIMPSGVNPPQ
jgi:hypothetical protein